MRAWVHQLKKQVDKHGADKASHYVSWIDPQGRQKCKSCGPGAAGRRNADKLAEQLSAELLTGTYQRDRNERTTWDEFVKEYTDDAMPSQKHSTQVVTTGALGHFKRLVKPCRVSAIDTKAIDKYIAARKKEPARKGGTDLVSTATVNKELRHLKAALRKAVEWGYLAQMPVARRQRERVKLATYVTPEHFVKLYAAAERAGEPSFLPVATVDWWRALLLFAYMTGWRIGSIMALRWEDVDLEEGTALSRAQDNKGGRDQRISLHTLVVSHLRKIAGFSGRVFVTKHGRRQLYESWHELQKLAQVQPDTKLRYGFHDLRRAFATENAELLSVHALQMLMQHKSIATTQGYINMAKKMKPAAHNLFVPDLASATA